MSKSKIEIISRNVDFPGNEFLTFPYQHLFLVYTAERETPLSVSASPEKDNYLAGNIYVKRLEYRSGANNKDFKVCQDSQCFSAIQIVGDSSLVHAKWLRILERAEHINAAKIDYDNALLCETPLNLIQILGEGIDRTTTETFTSEPESGSYYASTYICNALNSNTVVRELLDYAGIIQTLPRYTNDKQVDVPGWDSVFDREKLDRQKSEQDFLKQDKPYTIDDMFDSLEATGVLEEAITNKERALRMAEYERKQGNVEGVKLYEQMARMQDQIERIFDNIPGANNQDEKDEL